MPWCDTCDRFLSPSTVQTDGSCPTCGRPVAPGGARSGSGRRWFARLPWHVKLLLGVLAVYLAYRVVQGVEWVAGQL